MRVIAWEIVEYSRGGGGSWLDESHSLGDSGIHPGGEAHKHFLTGMLVREQISTTQKNRMTLNSNPKQVECPKIQTQKTRMT